MAIRFVRVDHRNTEPIGAFLRQAGTSLRTFRYFSTRPLSIVRNHLCTWVIEDDGGVHAYGHLDCDCERVWLGIAVAERSRSKGLGRLMMRRLVESADELGVGAIRLTVDVDNITAIHLYESFGFHLLSQEDGRYLYERNRPLSDITRSP